MKSRRHLQHHVVLIQLGEHGGYLPLSIRIVQRVVDHRRRDAKPGSGGAVVNQLCAETGNLLVARHIAKLRADFGSFSSISGA